MGSFIVRMFIHDGSSGTNWQAVFWIAMVAAIGMGGFYSIVAMNTSGAPADAAVRGMIGCAQALGYILVLRAIAWLLALWLDW